MEDFPAIHLALTRYLQVQTLTIVSHRESRDDG